MENKSTIKTPLTKDEKKKILEEKIKKMQLQVKQLDASKKNQERKERARELIQIGAIVSQFHDRKDLLKYLQETPTYIYVDEVGALKRTKNLEEIKGKKIAIFIEPQH